MNGGMAMSSYKVYKQKALQNPEVKAEYDALSAELAGEIADDEIRREKETALKFCETALNI